ncbi:hypothetical protein FPZ54_06695 [Sphingomonas suaedae]|uniref:Uncharacterized protein n=1 Tax=Sphingomonas suaedae TaxID=2599297 RepID=A0A518RE45_9SPHN|nr:hypothetical protein [Sphingomonas suaedae]QDX25737.1 hypothetical protein FPZ54_06695 [Sphingomonas suaedae]
MTDETLERVVLRYLASDASVPKRFQSLRKIVELMPLPEEWWEASLGGLEQYDLEKSLLPILDDLANRGLIETYIGAGASEKAFRLGSEETPVGVSAATGSRGNHVEAVPIEPESHISRTDLDDDDKWLLRILASHKRHTGDDIIIVPDAFERFGIPLPSRWIHGALEKLEVAGFVNLPPELAEQFKGPLVTVTEQGVMFARRLDRENGVDDAFDLLRASPETKGSSPSETGGQDEGEASDTLVVLDHSDQRYHAIKEGLESLYEQVRQDNEVGTTPGERNRILISLSAAKELWSSAELQLIQIRVGVIMAVEDATRALVAVGKSAVKSIIIDMIKDYIKSKIGITL